MKVILLKKIPGLGEADQIKEVADGYARNFLFPNHLAVQATPSSAKELAEKKKRVEKKSVQDLEAQQKLAGQIDGLEVEISEKTNGNGGLYGAITPQRISKSLSKMGFSVKPEQIVTKPLKLTGSFPVTVKLGHGLEAEITVIIEAEA